MAKNYNNFCVTPQDQIAKAPDSMATSNTFGSGQWNGEKGYPSRDSSPVLPKEKTYDFNYKGTPTDESRGTKA